MKTHAPFRHNSRGFTLLEVTTVIVILLIFMRLGLYSTSKIDQWKLGRNASEVLRSVHAAQRMFLADNPTVNVTTITPAMILPYLPPGNITTMPTVRSLTGANLSITVSVSPPIINNGAGVAYDPSGKTNDSLWDIGE
jgi:prepilin-type N-terminal cleavage/methylation domain-containing protein